MARIDYANRIIECKVVYYGPALAGKTANLAWIWQKTKSPEASWMRLDAPNRSNAQYYDYLPLMLGDIRGFKTRLHLFTVPGAPAYSAARRQLLESVDGLVFVADSRRARAAENVASLLELRQALASFSFALEKLPFVIQCNMGDAPDAAPPAEIAAQLAVGANVPVFQSVASTGVGVFDTLKDLAKLVLSELRNAGT